MWTFYKFLKTIEDEISTDITKARHKPEKKTQVICLNLVETKKW